MLHEAGVNVIHDQRLASITKQDGRIVSLTTESGNTYVAKVFIDQEDGVLVVNQLTRYTPKIGERLLMNLDG